MPPRRKKHVLLDILGRGCGLDVKKSSVAELISGISHRLDIKLPTVNGWVYSGQIPKYRVEDLVEKTGGRLKKEDLEPFVSKPMRWNPKNGIRVLSSEPKSELMALLLRAAPPDAEGVRSIKSLAEAIGATYQSIYSWINRETIPPNRVMQLVNVSRGELDVNDLLKFVIS